MSNIDFIIEERAATIGNFMVGRLLPFRQKRMVGPFIFIDHMAPTILDEATRFDVPPHPHIGLSTLTFLFDGSILHRDALGNKVEITPGAVNWMTAGKGIVHSERIPDNKRNAPITLHGLQIWVALPKELEQMDPAFFHIDANQLPQWNDADCQFTLVAGEAFGHTFPVPVYSKLFILEIKADKKQIIEIGDQLFGEVGIYILAGSIEINGEIYQSKQLLVSTEDELCGFTIAEGSSVYLFGGLPFDEPRYIDWNFVASDPSLIANAKQKWIEQAFDKIHGDYKEYVPYPVGNR